MCVFAQHGSGHLLDLFAMACTLLSAMGDYGPPCPLNMLTQEALQANTICPASSHFDSTKYNMTYGVIVCAFECVCQGYSNGIYRVVLSWNPGVVEWG